MGEEGSDAFDVFSFDNGRKIGALFLSGLSRRCCSLSHGRERKRMQVGMRDKE